MNAQGNDWDKAEREPRMTLDDRGRPVALESVSTVRGIGGYMRRIHTQLRHWHRKPSAPSSSEVNSKRQLVVHSREMTLWLRVQRTLLPTSKYYTHILRLSRDQFRI